MKRAPNRAEQETLAALFQEAIASADAVVADLKTMSEIANRMCGNVASIGHAFHHMSEIVQSLVDQPEATVH